MYCPPVFKMHFVLFSVGKEQICIKCSLWLQITTTSIETWVIAIRNTLKNDKETFHQKEESPNYR